MRKIVSVLALVFVFTVNASAADKTLTEIAFTNGVTYDGNVPAAYTPVVKAIKVAYPKATFTAKDGRLLVGIPGLKDEVKIECTSDCPVNSQFQQRGANNKVAAALLPTTTELIEEPRKGVF